MKQYEIIVETLTDIMPGSGESFPGVADNDSRFDENGLPYMNGKTLKGHLREQMERISRLTGSKIKADDLLGSSDFSDEMNGIRDPGSVKKPARIFLSNLCLPAGVRAEIAKKVQEGKTDHEKGFTKEEIQDSLSFVYTSTKIDENGIAQDHSLRKSRMIRKGLTFTADLFAEDLTDEEYRLLDMSVRAIQHIGTYKSKGKGAVSCKLLAKDTKTAPQSEHTHTARAAGTVVKYRILAEEPVKMGTGGSQSNTETFSCLLGSSLRGAVIGMLLHGGGLDEAELNSLLKDVRFTDAYPVFTQKGSSPRALMPFPTVFYADKHKIREVRKNGESSDDVYLEAVCRMPDPDRLTLSADDLGNNPAEGEQSIGRGAYAFFERADSGKPARLYEYNVSKIGNLHIVLAGKERNKSTESTMFRYEAIAPGQEFMGLISCKDEKQAARICSVLDGQFMYLGGSRGSGYGRCHFLSCETVTEQEASAENIYGIPRQKPAAGDGKKLLTIYALSNLILLDEYGRETGHISEKFLEKKLGIQNVRLRKSYVTIFHTDGFNRTWQAGQVQRSAVSTGSFFFYEYEGTLDPAKVEDLERNGTGLRRQDGFGRIFIDPDLAGFADESGKIRIYSISGGKETVDEPVLDNAEKAVLKIIRDRIWNRRGQDFLKRCALECSEKNRYISKKFSKTQMSRLLTVLMNEDKEELRKFMDNLTTSTKSGYNTTQFYIPIGRPDGFKSWKAVSLTKLFEDVLGGRISFSENTGIPEEYVSSMNEFDLNYRFLALVFYDLTRQEGGSQND